MNTFEKEIINYLGEENFQKVQAVTVGIAGCGGLGSNCAVSLVRSGIKKLVLVDFDRVETTNLNRQFYFQEQVGMPKIEALRKNLLKINPDCSITTHQKKIESRNIIPLFSGCDIVVEALDTAEYKSLLVKTLLPLNKLIVAASGLAGWGNSDQIKTRRLKHNLILIGDLTSEATDKLPPLSPRVSIAAAKQADAALEHILSTRLQKANKAYKAIKGAGQ